MLKRIIKISALVMSAVMLICFACGCGITDVGGDGKLQIVSASFPGYDFACRVFGDAAEVTLLVPPGSESHSYEPSAKDIAAIAGCDLFIYTGGESDTWIGGILSSLGGNIKTLRMIDCIDPIGADGHEDHGDSAVYDEHVWTSPLNAAEIAKGICSAAVSLSEENKEAYEANTAAFATELALLDRDFRALFDRVKTEKGNITLVFGDRFPLLYFTEEYGLDHISAFPGCSHETEISAAQMSIIIDKVKNDGISTVFYMDFSNHVIADSIAEATGASVKRLYSCHNVTREQLEGGASYISLMRENLAVFAEAFN